MQGKIVKGIAGFYYVHCADMGILECKAKGIFRNRNIKPLVGDNVEIDVIDEKKLLGNISDILPRYNELIRPAAANIDQAVIIFAVTRPEPNFNLLAKFIIMMDSQKVSTIICFNKMELADTSRIEELSKMFSGSGCRVVFASAYTGEGIDELKEIIKGRTTIFAGPSGVGKSSITNIILPEAAMETGGISEKIGRGKHTTRHTEIFNVSDDTYILDTPGFTSLSLTDDFSKEDIRFYFDEFAEYEGKCRFNGCVHVNEPDCAVKTALEEGNISRDRYKNYLEIYEELKEKEKRRY